MGKSTDPILEAVLREIRRLAVSLAAQAIKDPAIAAAVGVLIREASDAAIRRLMGSKEITDKELTDWLRKAQEVSA